MNSKIGEERVYHYGTLKSLSAPPPGPPTLAHRRFLPVVIGHMEFGQKHRAKRTRKQVKLWTLSPQKTGILKGISQKSSKQGRSLTRIVEILTNSNNSNGEY